MNGRTEAPGPRFPAKLCLHPGATASEGSSTVMLVGYDGSADSQPAVDHAGLLMPGSEATVVVISERRSLRQPQRLVGRGSGIDRRLRDGDTDAALEKAALETATDAAHHMNRGDRPSVRPPLDTDQPDTLSLRPKDPDVHAPTNPRSSTSGSTSDGEGLVATRYTVITDRRSTQTLITRVRSEPSEPARMSHRVPLLSLLTRRSESGWAVGLANSHQLIRYPWLGSPRLASRYLRRHAAALSVWQRARRGV